MESYSNFECSPPKLRVVAQPRGAIPAGPTPARFAPMQPMHGALRTHMQVNLIFFPRSRWGWWCTPGHVNSKLINLLRIQDFKVPAANSNSYLSLSRPWVGFEFLLKICWACPQSGIGLLAFRVDTPIVTQILLKNSVAALVHVQLRSRCPALLPTPTPRSWVGAP